MSSIFLSIYLTCKTVFLNFFPLQASHLSLISDINCISIFISPSPLHSSHLPPSTLNEKCFGFRLNCFDDFWFEKRVLISSYALIYVAGFDLEEVPIGFWSIYSIDVIDSRLPLKLSNSPGFSLKIPFSFSNDG